MQWPQENIPIKITITKNTKIIIVILMKEIRDIHQTITIIIIINLCNNKTSQIITIKTTVMIMTIKIKESLITRVMRILKNIVHIQQKDKKYVCQRGQFEGFYVESVEFCKLKIAQGSPGLQGQQGPPGPQGPMEPPGEPVPQDPNQINPTSIYEVGASATASTEGTGEATSTAMCDQGDSALSGSYGIANTPVFVTDLISETRDG